MSRESRLRDDWARIDESILAGSKDTLSKDSRAEGDRRGALPARVTGARASVVATVALSDSWATLSGLSANRQREISRADDIRSLGATRRRPLTR